MSEMHADTGAHAGTVMEDWAQLISFGPDLVLRPTNLDELKALLERSSSEWWSGA